MVESTNLTWPPESCREPAEFMEAMPPSAIMLRCSVDPGSVSVCGRGRLDDASLETGGGTWQKQSVRF